MEKKPTEKKLVKKAFSLIELSIVLLIIGIIAGGITQSSRLIVAFRLSAAKTLTESSPVASMKNLVVWFEATSKESFLDVETENALAISLWRDINPTSTDKNNATQTTEISRPTYKTRCINYLPCVHFDSTFAQFLNFDGTDLAATNYTVIIVEQRTSSKTDSYFLGGEGTEPNTNLILGYRGSTTATFAQNYNDVDVTVAAYTTPIPRIHSYIFNSSEGRKYYINGALQTLTELSGYDATKALESYVGAHLGTGRNIDNLFYDGDIAEVIIIGRDITAIDREAIEKYLAKKWGIVI